MILLTTLLASTLLTNLAEVATGMREKQFDARYDADAVVIFLEVRTDGYYSLGLRDATDEVFTKINKSKPATADLRLGDHVHVNGVIRQTKPLMHTVAFCSSVSILSHGSIPEPRTVSAREILSGSCNDRFVAVRGTVVDSFRDEIDTHTYFIVLDCDREPLYVSINAEEDLSGRLGQLDNAEVEVRGQCTACSYGLRKLANHTIDACKLKNIRVLHAPRDRFNVPQLQPADPIGAADVLKLGRRRACGTVIAVWGRNHALLHQSGKSTVTVELSGHSSLPTCGQTIEVVGFAETDLYRINLSHGLWRESTNAVAVALDHPEPISARELLTDGHGAFRVNPNYHGRSFQIRGIIQDINPSGGFTLRDDGIALSVDIGLHPEILHDLAIGSSVTVTGVCILNAETWKPYGPFPRTKGYTLVLRTPDDLTVLSAPPWWTVDRLLIALGLLLAALLGIFAWNRTLSRLVEKRSRQLTKEEVAHAQADLRAEERTRLSVELHDTIAQNLTGVALQLDSVELAAAQDPEAVPKYVANTRQSLQSCREDLRNCLWDLRNRAFEEKTLDSAIRKTLAPHLNGTTLDLAFDVRTTNLSGNTVHAILCIVRELAVNAIRHGRAKTLVLHGTRENDGGISFSVRDDGCGFDPKAAPGLSKGHFGLQGIRERIHRLGGTFTITSASGAGTTAEIRDLPSEA